MGRRAWILTVVLVSFAFLAGFMAGDLPQAPESPALSTLPAGATTPGPAAEATPSPTLSVAPADLRPPLPSKGEAEGTTVGSSPRPALPVESEVVLGGLRPASIRVRVLDAAGAPVEGADVRAIPAGVGVPTDEVPFAETDALGRATVLVPAEARYSVTVRSGLLVAVREGVPATVEGPAEVVVGLGRTAVIQVSVRGAPNGAPWTALAIAPGPTLADGTSVGHPFDCSGTTELGSLDLTVPEHVPFSLQVMPQWGDPRWHGLVPATPSSTQVSAPGSFVAEFRQPNPAEDRPRTVRVELEVALEAESGVLPPSGRVAFTFHERVDGSTSTACPGWVDWGPEDPRPSVSHATGEWPPRTAGSIEWTVGGVPGSVAVPAAPAGETLRLAATVRVPASAVTTGVDTVEVLDEHDAPVPVGGPEETSADLFTPDDELGFSDEASAASHVREWLRTHAGQPVVATRGPWRVSRPGSTATGSTLRLQLELGGYLLVHVRKPLPRRLGGLVAERRDGAWLGTYVSGDALADPADAGESTAARAGTVQNGTLLGPLPPGDVALRFRLGGVEVGRATAHVVAGEVSVLTIR